jgi:integrase
MAYGDGRVYRRGVRYWIAYSIRGREIREGSWNRPGEARKALRERLARIRLGHHVPVEATRRTLTQALDALLVHLETRGIRSLRSYRYHLAPVRLALGDLRVSDLTVADVEKYQQGRLGQGRAPATVNRECETLRQALRLAEDRGELLRAIRLPHLKTENTRRGFFERAEFERVCQFLPWHIAEAARFAYLTGWRKSEVLPLRWDQVDIERGEIRLHRSKTGRPRTVPIAGELSGVIERCAASRRFRAGGVEIESAFLFHRYGRGVKDIAKPWTRACRLAKVPGRLFHDLRRTAARNLIVAGVPQSVAMEITGHVTASVFRRYAITTETDKRAALEAISKAEAAHRVPRTRSREANGRA